MKKSKSKKIVKKRKATSRKAKQVKQPLPVLLDLGCGKNKREGFTGVDAKQFDGKVDIIHDLRTRWPWDDDSVDEVNCSHFLEHLTQEERVFFANELYRVLKNGAKALIIVPSWTSERAYGDPTHKWPPVVGFSFFYWNAAWRKDNAPHTGFTCNFDFGGGNQIAPPWNMRAQEVQMFAQNHYLNVATDVFVNLVAVKESAIKPERERARRRKR